MRRVIERREATDWAAAQTAATELQVAAGHVPDDCGHADRADHGDSTHPRAGGELY
jgi:hypothetical protein